MVVLCNKVALEMQKCGFKVTAANLLTRWKKWIVFCRISGLNWCSGVSYKGQVVQGGGRSSDGKGSRIPTFSNGKLMDLLRRAV